MENNSSQQPQKDVISDYVNEMQEMDREYSRRSVKKARNALYTVAVLMFIGEMLSMALADQGFSVLILVVALVEAGVFAGLALWTKRKPYYALIAGIVTFIGIQILAVAANIAAGDGEGVFKTLFGGIIIKIVVLVTLFRALGDAKTIQQYREQ